jgi:signal peptidase I
MSEVRDSGTGVAPVAVSGLSRVMREAKSMAGDFLRFGAMALLVTTFVIQPVRVEGTSMLPGLHDGERVLVNKFLYPLDGWPTSGLSIGRPVKRGDVVVFYYPNDPSARYVKRVIGVPGDTVRIDEDGAVYVNGRQLEEPYLAGEYTQWPMSMPATTVKEHYYFVLGDNRDNSSDSRTWGLVPEKYICGEAIFRFWPITEIGPIGD